MKVFSDLHHEDLYYSLQLLFEKRFGAELYRPIGLDWYEQNYWAIYPHISTARQYLDLSNVPPMNIHGVSVVEEHGEGAWINKDNFIASEGIHIVPDRQHANGIPHRAITLDKFRETKFDILLCSIPAHLPIWKLLKERYQPQAKIVFQAGNNWGYVDCENLLTSSRCTFNNKHSVHYHQEFDLSVFRPSPEKERQSIVNLQHYSSSVPRLMELSTFLPSWNVLVHGAGNKDGSLHSLQVPEKLAKAGFLWHVKSGGDGYGYNLHEAIACGIPVIVNSRDIIGTTAEAVCRWGTSALDIHGKSMQQVGLELEQMVQNYDSISQSTAKLFSEVVNFEEQFVRIKTFLENLR